MKQINMSYSDFIKEHKHLIKILRNGSKDQRTKESNKQLKELMKIKTPR